MPDAADRPAPRKRRWRRRLAALAAGLLVGLLVAECSVRLVLPQDLTGSWIVQCPQRGQMLNKASGTSRHQLGSRVVSYRFNSLHLRGPEPSPTARRVLCLGDSFTFGWLLEEEDTYVRRLQALARREMATLDVEFLNGSVGGWGASDYVAFVETYGDRIRPSLVVVFLSSMDVSRSTRSGLYAFDDQGTLTPRNLPSLGGFSFVRSVPGYEFALEHSHLAQLLRRILLRSGSDDPGARAPEPASDLQAAAATRLATALFARLKAWCDARSLPLVVLTTGFQSVHASGVDERFFEQAPTALRDDLKIPFADLAPRVFGASGGAAAVDPALQIPGDWHPNERGAERIATAAWPELKPHLERLR